MSASSDTVRRRIRSRPPVGIRELFKIQSDFIDAPLLFETGLEKSVEEVWVIDADDETRIRRIMERDGLEREEILLRISSQMERGEKNRRADVVLDNTGGSGSALPADRPAAREITVTSENLK